MNTRLPPSVGPHALGLILASSGACVLLAPFVISIQPTAAPLCWLVGVVMLAAGIGLYRARLWGWYLTLGIAATGMLVVGWRPLVVRSESWHVLAGR
jgi:hypothetical protein